MENSPNTIVVIYQLPCISIFQTGMLQVYLPKEKKMGVVEVRGKKGELPFQSIPLSFCPTSPFVLMITLLVLVLKKF